MNNGILNLLIFAFLIMLLKNLLPASLFETLDRAGISTTNHILTLSNLDIKKYTNLKDDDIIFIKDVVASRVCPDIVPCNILKGQCNSTKTRVPTGCKVIDDLLKGGFQRGTLTEIYGESGCGKTQLALQIALNNWIDGTVFICTEDLFPTRRFEQLKLSLPSFDSTIDYGKNVFVEHITESNDLLACISIRLPKLLALNKLSVVVIDSIAAPYRCESTNYIKRAEELREIALLLTSIAQKFNLAVLCINQVTASFDSSDNLLPSLGLAWSNMINTRLMILKTHKTVDTTVQTSCLSNCYVRELCIVFSPDLPNDKVEFVICSAGIEAVK